MKTVKVKAVKRGRPISFDKDSVIEVVMNKFWKQGYDGVSVNEIAKETGLTRASIYNSFESKGALFIAALQHYFESAPDAVLQALEPGVSVGSALLSVFKEAAGLRAGDDSRRGCFAINCLNEMLASETEVGEQLLELFNQRRLVLKGLIERAIEQNELSSETNAEISADLIMTYMCGFSTFSKSGASQKKLVSLSRSFLKGLGFTL
jgi:AcrR family transcriptional regulator